MTTAHRTLATRKGALLELFIEGGNSGWGEIAPLPEFGGGTLKAALTALTSFVERMHGKPLTLADLHDWQTQLPAAALCGWEMALLDALGKSTGRSVACVLAENRTSSTTADSIVRVRTAVPVNAVCGGASVMLAVEQARAAVAAGFSCIKLKVGGQEPIADIERVATVRRAIGPAIRLRLDANEGWTFEQARFVLERCAPYDIQYVEQPLPADNLQGMCALRTAVPISIAADESLRDLTSVRRVLAERAADVLVIKPQVVGGLLTGLQIIQEAADAGVACVITSILESGVGVAGALHLAAAAPEVTLECGLATLNLLSDDLLQDGLRIEAGMMILPTGTGLGVEPDRAVLG